MADIFQLYRLQLVDSQLHQHENRIKIIEADLLDTIMLDKAQKKMDDGFNYLQSMKTLLKQAEGDVESHHLKIQNNNQSLYGGKVRNPKELQDLQIEGQALQRHLIVLEDHLIQMMINMEDANSLYEVVKTAYEQIKGERAHHAIQYQERLNVLHSDINRIIGERQAIINFLPKDILSHYEKLRETRGGTAVALVNDNTCTACGTTLSATLLRVARIPSQLSHCDLCGRILYVK